MMATTPTPTVVSQSVMLAAALQNAALGNYVFPLHTPIFNEDGKCTGCTCEEWKRTQEKYGPNFKCNQPGKCPRVAWAEKSTVDPVTIGKWWGKAWRNVDVETGQVVWSTPNLAVDCGKSGLLVPDLDSYKESYAGGALFLDENTVKSITGGGGSHLWYRMPEGKAYGNATGNLPKGIDIRGAGGYVVVAPSLHKSGRRYTFAEGFSPADIAPLPLPQSLIDILETAQEAHSGPTVTFSAGYVPMPDLAQWGLSGDTCELIQKGAPKGERSEADWRVVCELVRAGATDDDIRAVFVHFAIGSKFDEQGDKYLAHTVSRARARAIERPQVTKELFETARGFIRSPQFLETLRAGGITRVAGPIACLDALLETATPTRTTKIKITMRDLADEYSVSCMTASRHIKRLTEVGIIPVELIDGCTTVDLSNLLDKSVTATKECDAVTLLSTSDEAFYREHRGDDAFTSYPYVYAIKRRECPTVLMQSLGANGLLLWAALADGGTVKELAEATGLKVSSVRYALKRFKQANLLQSVQECGRATEYWLCSNAEELLEEKREHMVTSGKGQLSAGKNASDTASYAHRQLSSNAPLEPSKRAWLENRRDKCDAKASAIYASLESMGINPHAKVAHRTPRPNTVRFDAVEEWRSWGKDTWETLQCFGDMELSEKIRLLTVAEVGEDASIETYRNTRRAISERVDVALSLAQRRASLDFTYTHPDAQDDIPQVDATPTTLFAMPFVYA